MSNGQKKNLVERLETLEFQMSSVASMPPQMNGLRNMAKEIIEMMNALVDELGGTDLATKVMARIQDKRADDRRVKAERSAAILKQLLDSGQVEAVEDIAEDSIITGVENSPDGNVKDEHLQLNLAGFNNDVAKELLGKGVGYAVERNGVKVFVVDGIYKVKPAPPPQQLSEVPPTDVAPATPTEPASPSDTPAAPVSDAPAPTDAAQPPAETPPADAPVQEPTASPETPQDPAPTAEPAPAATPEQPTAETPAAE